jgi:hypothetical protein
MANKARQCFIKQAYYYINQHFSFGEISFVSSTTLLYIVFLFPLQALTNEIKKGQDY